MKVVFTLAANRVYSRSNIILNNDF